MVAQDEQAPLAPHAWSCQPFATLMSTPINRLLVAAAQNEPSASDDRPIVLRKLLRTIYTYLGNDLAVARGDRALRDFLAYQANRFNEHRDKGGRAATCSVRVSQPVQAKGDERSVHRFGSNRGSLLRGRIARGAAMSPCVCRASANDRDSTWWEVAG